jgi:hypothetical protein
VEAEMEVGELGSGLVIVLETDSRGACWKGEVEVSTLSDGVA